MYRVCVCMLCYEKEKKRKDTTHQCEPCAVIKFSHILSYKRDSMSKREMKTTRQETLARSDSLTVIAIVTSKMERSEIFSTSGINWTYLNELNLMRKRK